MTLKTLTKFDHAPRTRLVFGNGVVGQVGTLARDILDPIAPGDKHRVLLVTDPGLMKVGHPERVVAALENSRLTVCTFFDTHENPTTDDVDACVVAAEDFKPTLVVALGGGSALDTAKGCNFVYTNGGAMADYHGVGKAALPMLPLVAIPTTAGTGSETQSFALIAKSATSSNPHEKMACGDPKAAARVAVLDPELTVTQPAAVTAAAGIDAIAHAVESFVCTRRNPVSTMFARESLRHTLCHLPDVLDDPNDLDARGAMLWGAALAGLAIENSMLGAAHAAANPLTARYGVTHGHAVGLLLPHVVRFNAEDPATQTHYDTLARSVRLDGADALADCLAIRLEQCGFVASLAALKIPADDIATLAAHAATQWTGTFNPRPVDIASFKLLYKAAGLGHAD